MIEDLNSHMRNSEYINFEIKSEIEENSLWGKHVTISTTTNGFQHYTFAINNNYELQKFIQELSKYSEKDFSY